MKVLCGRTPAKRRSSGRRAARLGRGRHRLAARSSGARTSTSSTSRRRATATPRSRLRRPGRARSSSARSRWPTRVQEAEQMLAAVEKAGVLHMICHNYRRAPAVMLAKQLIEEGKLGETLSLPRHVPAGLDRRPDVPAGLAAATRRRPVRRARRHRRALARPRAVPRRRDHGGGRRARDVRQGAAAAGQSEEEGHA